MADSSIDLPIITEAHIWFENNTAQEVGGALFFLEYQLSWIKPCSFNLMTQNMIAHTQDVLMFIENTAISGDVIIIYGAYFDFDCYDDGAAQSQRLTSGLKITQLGK